MLHQDFKPGKVEAGDVQGRQACGHRPQHGHALRLEAQHLDHGDTGGGDNQGRRQAGRPSFQGKEGRESEQAQDEGGQVGRIDLANELAQFPEKTAGFAPVAEQLGQLPHEHDQGDPVEVADENGLGEKIGDKPQPTDAKNDVEQPRDQGDGDHQLQVALRVAAGERTQGRGHHQAGGRVRADDQLPR